MRAVFLILIGLNSLSFAEFSKHDGVITDVNTKLEWQDDYGDNDGNIKKANWQNSINYCEDLILNGKKDWRLPNINELNSIVDYTTTRPSINKIFENIVEKDYWSSTSNITKNNRAWYISFETGNHRNESKNYDKYVRCVRDAEN